MNAMTPITAEKAGAIAEAVLIRGDLNRLTPTERAKYCVTVCQSLGLNPMTKPFAYIELNGKLTLYALKDATDQLRTIHDVSVTELIESEREGVFIVTAKVANAKGRTDAAKGAVNIAGLKGEALANALMKAETKAKRRATLSICGLGFLDETEVEDIPASAKAAAPAADVVSVPAVKAAQRRRRASDPTLVVWENDEVRPPTYEEGHHHNEQVAEDWGNFQGNRLLNAMRQTRPANDGLDIPPALRRTKPEPTLKERLLSDIPQLASAQDCLRWSLAMSGFADQLRQSDRDEVTGALTARQRVLTMNGAAAH